MVKECIVLGHLVSERGIKIDKETIEVIEKLIPPTIAREVRTFLKHADFYQCFIKKQSKIAKPLTRLLMKVVEFIFKKKCNESFKMLKQA